MPKVDELLRLETDGSCATCGVRDPRYLTVHHLVQSDPKDESYDNKILLCYNCHGAFHKGKGISCDDLSKIKRRLIMKILTQPGLNALKEAYRRSLVVAMPFLVNHLVEMGYLRLECEGTTWGNRDGGGIVDAEYCITASGRTLLQKWDLK